MTAEKIYKFKNNLDTTSFESIFFRETDKLELIDTDIKIDFSAADKIIKNLYSNYNEPKINDIVISSDYDLSVELYKVLKNLPRKLLLDMSFWQWMSVIRFRDYTLMRWLFIQNINNYKIIIENQNFADRSLIFKENKINTALVVRMIGGTSVKAINSRNALSRLFWSCEFLYDDLDEYLLLEFAYKKQDIMVSLFERNYSLNKKIAQSFVRGLKKRYPDLTGKKKEIQLEAKTLNQYFSILNPDSLNLEDLEGLI